jgi:hypothetical protein
MNFMACKTPYSLTGPFGKAILPEAYFHAPQIMAGSSKPTEIGRDGDSSRVAG